MDRRSFLSRLAVGGGALAVAGSVASCGSGASSASSTTVAAGPPRRGGALTMGTTAETDGFFPPQSQWDTNGFLYANTIYDPLMAVAADGTIQPYLAQSLSANSRFDVWTMTLRDNVHFHDGSLLTSAVVLANFRALQTSPLTAVPLELVQSVTAPDARTVVFTLRAPAVSFPADLTTQVGYVVGEAYLNSGGNGTPVGTGPFVYAEWVQNSHFRATRNPRYWQAGLPYLDQITFRPIPDTTQRESTLTTRGIDLLLSQDASTIKKFTGTEYQLVDSATGVIGQPTMGFIMLNLAAAPTDDPRIRLALAKATDQAVLNKIFGAGLTPAVDGMFLPGSPYYSATGYPSFDPSGAKKLVAAYAKEHGAPKLTLTTIATPQLVLTTQAIQQMWGDAGISLTIATVDQSTLIAQTVLGDFQAATSENFGAVDPDLNYVWLSSTTVAPVGSLGLNFPRNDDPVIEQALLRGRSSAAASVRVPAYQQINRRLAADLPYLWTGQILFSVVANARVRNLSTQTLPGGQPGYAFGEGAIFPTELWLSA